MKISKILLIERTIYVFFFAIALFVMLFLKNISTQFQSYQQKATYIDYAVYLVVLLILVQVFVFFLHTRYSETKSDPFLRWRILVILGIVFSLVLGYQIEKKYQNRRDRLKEGVALGSINTSHYELISF